MIWIQGIAVLLLLVWFIAFVMVHLWWLDVKAERDDG